jgi:hypothetical protein
MILKHNTYVFKTYCQPMEEKKTALHVAAQCEKAWGHVSPCKKELISSTLST